MRTRGMEPGKRARQGEGEGVDPAPKHVVDDAGSVLEVAQPWEEVADRSLQQPRSRLETVSLPEQQQLSQQSR